MKYRITATIINHLDCTDSGAWQMGMTWRKSLILDPAESDEAANARQQAYACSDPVEAGRLFRQVESLTAREQTRLAAQAQGLIRLLNNTRPATDPQGAPLWDRGYALCGEKTWQWQIVAPAAASLTGIMRAAGIDDWPPEDQIPDIANPEITINLSLLD